MESIAGAAPSSKVSATVLPVPGAELIADSSGVGHLCGAADDVGRPAVAPGVGTPRSAEVGEGPWPFAGPGAVSWLCPGLAGEVGVVVPGELGDIGALDRDAGPVCFTTDVHPDNTNPLMASVATPATNFALHTVRKCPHPGRCFTPGS
jgi:hypothetical protein